MENFILDDLRVFIKLAKVIKSEFKLGVLIFLVSKLILHFSKVPILLIANQLIVIQISEGGFFLDSEAIQLSHKALLFGVDLLLRGFF